MNHAFMRPDPFDLFLRQVHAWSGWLLLALAMARIGLRYIHGVSPLPAGSSALARWGSLASHTVLYGLLLALPVTGTGAMYVSYDFAPMHTLLAWSLLAVALIHAGAALWHHFVRRDDVLRLMTVGFRTSI